MQDLSHCLHNTACCNNKIVNVSLLVECISKRSCTCKLKQRSGVSQLGGRLIASVGQSKRIAEQNLLINCYAKLSHTSLDVTNPCRQKMVALCTGASSGFRALNTPLCISIHFCNHKSQLQSAVQAQCTDPGSSGFQLRRLCWTQRVLLQFAQH